MASRSLISCSLETIRITPSFSIFRRPRVSRMISRARSHGTFRNAIDILPFTSSPITMFLLLSAARMRRRFTTSASLKSNEMRRWPLVGAAGAAGAAGVAWVNRSGGAAGAGTGAVGAATVEGAGSAGAAGAGAEGAPAAGAAGVAGAGAGFAWATIGEVGMTIARPLGSSRIA
jgi:hypothetical protein